MHKNGALCSVVILTHSTFANYCGIFFNSLGPFVDYQKFPDSWVLSS